VARVGRGQGRAATRQIPLAVGAIPRSSECPPCSACAVFLPYGNPPKAAFAGVGPALTWENFTLAIGRSPSSTARPGRESSITLSWACSPPVSGRGGRTSRLRHHAQAHRGPPGLAFLTLAPVADPGTVLAVALFTRIRARRSSSTAHARGFSSSAVPDQGRLPVGFAVRRHFRGIHPELEEAGAHSWARACAFCQSPVPSRERFHVVLSSSSASIRELSPPFILFTPKHQGLSGGDFSTSRGRASSRSPSSASSCSSDLRHRRPHATLLGRDVLGARQTGASG